MFNTIFRNEMYHWLRQPYVYLFATLIFFIAFATMWGMAAEAAGGPDAEMMNSYYRINFMSNYLSLLMLFVLPGTLGAAVYRDYKSQMYTLLYAYPITKPAYLLAKFLAAYLVVAIIVSMIGLGFALGTQMPGVNADVVLPFNIAAYAQLYGVYILPNMFLLGLLVFAIVIRTRNVYVGFISIILLVIFQGVVGGLLSGEGTRYWAALLDPTGDTAVKHMVSFWTKEARNTQALPITGVILHNRILWLSIAIGLALYTYRSFHFQQFSGDKKGKNTTIPEPKPQLSYTPWKLPAVQLDFSFRHRVRTAWQIALADFRYVVYSWPFIAILIAGFLLVYFQQHQMNPMYGFNILPTTGRMLMVPMFIFSLVINLLTFLYIGVLQFRGQSTGMGALIDTVPQPNWLLLLSRLGAAALMQLLLLGIVMLGGIAAQTIQGYYHYEVWHYLFELLGLQFVHFLIWACVAMLVHTLVKSMYLGFFILLLMPTAVAGLRVVGDFLNWPFLRESILQFNQVPGITVGFRYSDLSGYGHILPLYYAFKGYWLILGIVFLLLSLLWWRRGELFGWRERFQLVKKRFTGPLKSSILFSAALFLLLGGYLYVEENFWATAQYTKAKEEQILVNNEKRYLRFQDFPQPKIAKANIKMDIYPDSRDFTASGQLLFVNKMEALIDTILVATSFREITTYQLTSAHQLVSQDPEVRFDVWKLDQPLAKGDTLGIDFTVRNYPNSALHDNSRVVSNGTYINANILPALGFRNTFLRDAEKRSEYGLPPREAHPHLPSDTTLLGYTFSQNNMDRVEYETIVSTARGQEVFSMGNLVRSWKEGDRQYAHYRSNGLITNNISWLSGRYLRKTAQTEHINLALYHHPTHDHNYEHLVGGLSASLDYCARWFGPLAYDSLRLVEFPLTEGTHATLNGNLIPYSEALFLCDVDAEDNSMFNLPFYTSAHEVAHYWWGHRVDPANVQGGKLVTEALAEYIAMQVLKHEFGTERLFSFRKKMHDVYLRERAREGAEEPLITAKLNQEYLNYRKGGLAFYALSQYWGEEQLNTVLASYEKARRYAPPPYPTSLELVDSLRANIPDSLVYLVHDYFETITLYDNQIQKAVVSLLEDGSCQMELEYRITKYRSNASGKRILEDQGERQGRKPSLPSVNYVQIGFYKELPEGEELIELRTIKVNDIQNHLSLRLAAAPDRIVIDPDLLLFEEDREDNEWRSN